MMKKLVVRFLMLLFVLGMSTNAAWGQELKVYFASLKAQTSPASTGSGDVKLTWVDILGKPLEVELGAQLNGYALGNPSAVSGPAATAQLVGATMCAMDGVEVAQEMAEQIYLTSYVYFHAEAEPAAGSYLDSWTFTDPAISRIDTAMGHIEYMPGDWNEELQDYLQVDPENSIPLKSPCFKLLPDTTNNAVYAEEGEGLGLMLGKVYEVANTSSKVNNLYAVFKKYLLSNPTATSGQLEAEVGNTATLDVTFDVEGDVSQFKEEYADFDFPDQAFYEDTYGAWTWDFAGTPVEFLSETKARAHAVITYTAKSGITTGTHNATLTVKMQGTNPSTLNIALSVDALDPVRPDALLLDGKDDAFTVGGTLEEILVTDISDYTNPIIKLNRQHDDAITLPSKNFTFDLNGNEAGDITIAGGEVTIAFSKFGGEAGALHVTGGKAILNGGTFASLSVSAGAIVEQNGATITGAATNAGTLITTEGKILGGLTSSKTLVLNGGTFKDKDATAVTVSGGTANINRGTIEGTTCGLKVTAGTATVKKLAAISGGTYSAQRTGGTLSVESGKFDGPLNGTVNFTAGFFKTNTAYGVSTEGKKEFLISAGTEYSEGYRYFLGDVETAKANGVGVCRIGNVSYATLEDAIAYANNNPGVANIVIFMTNDYTLPAGYYTLPANATIVVPMSDTQSKEVNKTAPRVVFNDVRNDTPYEQPTEFRRLTFASGVNMEVFGDIEMTCSQLASNEAYTSQPTGSYGRIVMEEGSHMTLQNGSEVRAWGFMTGKGETDARRGSKVREMFQLGDWKGAFTSVTIVGMFPLIGDKSDLKIFPVTQYFIQNIESPVKYHPGAILSTSAAVSEGLSEMSVSMAATDIAIVGVNGVDSAIFVMDQKADADNTWVRKWYDVENDIQTYDINSGAHIGQMVLDMGELNVPLGDDVFSVPVKLNSAKFDLPLTCNFKIHLLSGEMDFLQNTSLLPGAEVEVDKEATVQVQMDNAEKAAYEAWVDGGREGDAPVSYTGALYVYDAEEWGKYAYCNVAVYNAETDRWEMQTDKAYTKTVRYAPSWEGKGTTPGKPDVRNELVKPADAAINIHGTFMTASGFVYTSESGANIFSSNEDAGTFIFNDDAADAGTRTVNNVKGSSTFESLTFYPARLKHGDGTYENTNEAEADLAYCYQNDKWSTMTQDGCFMKENRGGNNIYYAKPQDYVALANGMTENEDHTYSDAAGTGRLFILMDNECQWWEVENVDNLYHCIHPDNNTYYYWADEIIDKHGSEDREQWDIYPAHWAEKKFTITWKNWDGTPIETDNFAATGYEVTYGTMAEFLGTNPTREATIDYTYDFTGWSPALGPVTSDVTYTATYTQKDRMYTIIFQNEGGTEIERQFLKHNDVPVCENTPTKIGHTLVWSPAVSPVIGDQTYTATWLENPPTEWDVTFVNNANGVLQATAAVGVNVHPTYNGSTPVKENADHLDYTSNEYTYTFWGWNAVIDGVAQQFAAGDELPCPTAPTTYTAVYTEAQKTYVVRFMDEEGTLIPGQEYNLPYGAMPVCSATPTKKNTAEWTYGFAWTPQIQTVQGAATYTATFPATKNRYTVTLTSNLNGVCTFTGAGTFDYYNNEGLEPGDEDYVEPKTISVSYDSEKYNFLGWNDDVMTLNRTIDALTADITLTANFSIKSMPNLEITAETTSDLENEYTEVKDLVITSNGSSCGQLLNANNLDIKGEAIFRMDQSFTAGQWYAVAVPWRVNPATGIYGASGRLALGSQIYIIEFDGAAYAQVGGTDDTYQYWHFLHETGADMVPGKLYMIYLTSDQSKLDFYKKAGAALQTRNLTVSTASGSAGASFANWNAISNPALYTADLSTGVSAYQTYDNNDGQTYTVVDAATSGIIVAKPIFVQVNTPGTVYATVPAGPDPAPAYRRARQVENEAKYVVEISRNGKMADRLIIETADEKADKYVIGKDLAKFGVSSKVAQMWINRYDAKLCKNTVEFDGERADYPLNIFAPAAGEYTLHLTPYTSGSDYALYLTLNGEAIWNLSDAAYTLNLNKGTDTNYGLRVSARAPQVATGMDEAVVDAQGDIRKVLINNQVFIIRGDKVYTIDGQLVK